MMSVTYTFSEGICKKSFCQLFSGAAGKNLKLWLRLVCLRERSGRVGSAISTSKTHTHGLRLLRLLTYLSLPPQPEAQPYGFFFWAFTRSIGLMGSREEGSSVAVLTAPQIRSYLCRTAERSLFNGKLWMWAGVSLALLRV